MQSGSNSVTTSPLLAQVLERKRLIYKSESKWKWALLNFIAAFALTVEANGYSSFQPFVDARSPWRTLISRLEMVIVIVLMTNAILDTMNYFFPFIKIPSLVSSTEASLNVVGNDLVLTPKQMSLFKIRKGDPGFKLPTPTKAKEGDKEKHPFGFSSPLEGSFVASSPNNSTRAGTSLYNRSGYHSGDTTGGFGGNYSSVDSSSWYYHRPNSPVYQQQPTSPPLSNSRILPKFNTSVAENGAISDQSDLKVFLKEYEDWEKSINHNSADISNVSGENNNSANVSGASFWKPTYSNINMGVGTQAGNAAPNYQDFSPILKKLSYQLSTAMPETELIVKANGNEAMDQTPGAVSSLTSTLASALSTVSHSFTTTGTGAANVALSGQINKIGSPQNTQRNSSAHSICRRLGVDSIQLVSWMENLRMWISQTILKRVVEEIKQTNELLVKYGMAEEQIGNIGIDKLRKVAGLPHILERIPSLNALMPYLELSNQQEYLVKRLSDLSEGGAISEYKWNTGGRHKGSEWSDKFPTDADIIMNCVAAYLDVRMPNHYHYTGNIDGKPFTGIYYLKALNSDLQKDGSVKKQENSSDPKAQKLSFFAKLLAATKSSNIPTTKEVDSSKDTSTPSQQHRNFVIAQTAQKPPHFVVQLNSNNTTSTTASSSSSSANAASVKDVETLEVGQGRNNLFHVLLLFLHLIKTKEQGMLGRINFGSSGINVLWVLND